MLRACIASSSRTVGSGSSFVSLFHTSTRLGSASTKRIGARNKKQNIANTQKRTAAEQVNRPSVVLGTRPSEEAEKWKDCDLSKVLVKEEDLTSSTELYPTQLPIGTVELPKHIAFGVDEAEKKQLFEALPLVSVEMRTVQGHERLAGFGNQPERLSAASATAEQAELKKAQLLAKALDLRNANAAGIAFENRRRIIQAFSTPENPFDPGRAEVQAALLTYKIRNLWTHLTSFKRDVGNRRGLTKLVHQRAKILKYIRNTNYNRYVTILHRLGLEPESVEGELVV